MNELKQLYQALIENKVSVKNEKHQYVSDDIFYTDTVYSFGPYKMVQNTLKIQETHLNLIQ